MNEGCDMSQIDLSRVRNILTETLALVDELNGVDHDERTAVDSQSGGEARKARARTSQALNLMGDRLELAASLVRVEYWVARGHVDPTNIRPGPRVESHRPPVDGRPTEPRNDPGARIKPDLRHGP